MRQNIYCSNSKECLVWRKSYGYLDAKRLRQLCHQSTNARFRWQVTYYRYSTTPADTQGKHYVIFQWSYWLRSGVSILNKPFKAYVRKLLEKHMKENFEDYVGSKISASKRQILITKWCGEAWESKSRNSVVMWSEHQRRWF